MAEHADARAQRGAVRSRSSDPNRIAPGDGPQQRGQHRQQRGLAGAVRPEQAEDRAGAGSEADAATAPGGGRSGARRRRRRRRRSRVTRRRPRRLPATASRGSMLVVHVARARPSAAAGACDTVRRRILPSRRLRLELRRAPPAGIAAAASAASGRSRRGCAASAQPHTQANQRPAQPERHVPARRLVTGRLDSSSADRASRLAGWTRASAANTVPFRSARSPSGSKLRRRHRRLPTFSTTERQTAARPPATAARRSAAARSIGS